MEWGKKENGTAQEFAMYLTWKTKWSGLVLIKVIIHPTLDAKIREEAILSESTS